VIRAFIAVGIEPKTVRKIAEAVQEIKSRAPAIRWASLTNLHLTLRFLGDVEEATVEPIARALREHVGPFPRFTINAKGLGVFPGVKRPRVLWVGLEGNQLIELASTVETALKSLGFAPEERDFKPHLTIGRWRQAEKSATQFVAELERWKGHEFGRSEVRSIALFQSTLRPEGAIHRMLAEITLSGERPLN
jgi:RNA 2',3'-cyclic 3'-phosphodiesterase